mmetsp:Transcript_102947/g.297614  ORF Transcript_102947/g.297614 Transcript_102947/m.297614 type:complete len:232 (+) Transcript_102947:306-1001(+)
MRRTTMCRFSCTASPSRSRTRSAGRRIGTRRTWQWAASRSTSAPLARTSSPTVVRRRQGRSQASRGPRSQCRTSADVAVRRLPRLRRLCQRLLCPQSCRWSRIAIAWRALTCLVRRAAKRSSKAPASLKQPGQSSIRFEFLAPIVKACRGTPCTRRPSGRRSPTVSTRSRHRYPLSSWSSLCCCTASRSFCASRSPSAATDGTCKAGPFARGSRARCCHRRCRRRCGTRRS